MATRRSSRRAHGTGTTRRRSSARKSRGGLSLPKLSLGLSPIVVRSLVGIVLLVLGAVTAIALLLPGQGALTDGWRNFSVPYFGTGRWLLPAVLLLSGWYLEWGPGKEPGAPWGRTLLGIAMAYAGLLGASPGARRRAGGGHIGRFLADLLEPALTTPGAFVILVGLGVGGPADRARPAAAGAHCRPRRGAPRPRRRRSRTARRRLPTVSGRPPGTVRR